MTTQDDFLQILIPLISPGEKPGDNSFAAFLKGQSKVTSPDGLKNIQALIKKHATDKNVGLYTIGKIIELIAFRYADIARKILLHAEKCQLVDLATYQIFLKESGNQTLEDDLNDIFTKSAALFNAIKTKNNAYDFSYFIEIAGLTNHYQQAKDTFLEAKNLGIATNDYVFSNFIASAAIAIETATEDSKKQEYFNDANDAYDIYQSNAKSWNPVIIVVFIKAAAAVNKFDIAESTYLTYQNLVTHAPEKNPYAIAAYIFSLTKQLALPSADKVQLYEKALAAYESFKPAKSKAITFEFINFLFHSDKLDEAESIFDRDLAPNFIDDINATLQQNRYHHDFHFYNAAAMTIALNKISKATFKHPIDLIIGKGKHSKNHTSCLRETLEQFAAKNSNGKFTINLNDVQSKGIACYITAQKLKPRAEALAPRTPSVNPFESTQTNYSKGLTLRPYGVSNFLNPNRRRPHEPAQSECDTTTSWRNNSPK